MPPSLNLSVELPSGGNLQLQTLDELELWEKAADSYQADYDFSKLNDKRTLGTILTQEIVLYRAQQKINGMEPEFDAKGNPTGNYVFRQMKTPEVQAAHTALTKASEQLRELERQLNIDKKSRDASSAHTTAEYVTRLKRAASEYGIHITKRTKLIEGFYNDLSWKLRVLRNADAEDRAYHKISERTILKWCEEQIDEIAEHDKKFSHEKGKLWRGTL